MEIKDFVKLSFSAAEISDLLKKAELSTTLEKAKLAAATLIAEAILPLLDDINNLKLDNEVLKAKVEALENNTPSIPDDESPEDATNPDDSDNIENGPPETPSEGEDSLDKQDDINTDQANENNGNSESTEDSSTEENSDELTESSDTEPENN